MTRDNLKTLLLHKHPSQEKEINEVIDKLPENVENAHVHLNYFRGKDPSLKYSDYRYYNTVFK
jgi:hypothetical protein